MHFSFDVAGPQFPQPQQVSAEQAVPANALELLREILEVQKEQLQLSRAIAMANDGGQRWRTFLSRWGDQFPNLAGSCKEVLPQLERAYMDLMNELTTRLQDDGDDALETEFALAEFLDRYGMKLGQIGTILNLVTPLAEAYTPPQPAAEEES
jgi:hypothetical protein